MIRTVLWFANFWTVMVFTLLLFIPYFFLFVFQKNKIKTFVSFCSSHWARYMIEVAGGKVEVCGLENIPGHNRICFISNHQGAFDIFLIVGYIPKIVGFIAKKELMKIPIVNFWMKALHCQFIDRKSARAALGTVQKAADQIRAGHPMLIFPEGTRSRCSNVGEFKKGSMKIPLLSESFIVPLTINGTYKLKEETGWIAPGHIKLTIHPPIDVSQLDEEEKNTLHTQLREIISGGIG